MENVLCSNCGELCMTDGIGTGYGETRDGRKLCYPCCEQSERDDFSTAAEFFAYLSSDGARVTTWTGGDLARVSYRKRHRGGFGGEYFTIDAVGADGSRWYGRGGGPGCWLKLRRRKSRA